MLEYYDPDGKPYEGDSLEQMSAATREPESRRRVAQDYLADGSRVSTVWLGLDHNWGKGVPGLRQAPLIFETAVFGPDGRVLEVSARYSTRQEAIDGHRAILKRAMQHVMG